MLQDGKPPTPAEPDGFPARLRQVIASYGSTSALARSIERSEGAIRKWLRGQSEPAVSDLRTICDVTGTNVEWLVMGRGDQQGLSVREPPASGSDDEPLGRLDYKLMDDVVLTVRLDPRIAGAAVTPEKCSSILATVYNMSRATRRVDTEAAERVIGIAS
jgi:hypothetical protein